MTHIVWLIFITIWFQLTQYDLFRWWPWTSLGQTNDLLWPWPLNIRRSRSWGQILDVEYESYRVLESHFGSKFKWTNQNRFQVKVFWTCSWVVFCHTFKNWWFYEISDFLKIIVRDWKLPEKKFRRKNPMRRQRKMKIQIFRIIYR